MVVVRVTVRFVSCIYNSIRVVVVGAVQILYMCWQVYGEFVQCMKERETFWEMKHFVLY